MEDAIRYEMEAGDGEWIVDDVLANLERGTVSLAADVVTTSEGPYTIRANMCEYMEEAMRYEMEAVDGEWIAVDVLANLEHGKVSLSADVATTSEGPYTRRV